VVVVHVDPQEPPGPFPVGSGVEFLNSEGRPNTISQVDRALRAGVQGARRTEIDPANVPRPGRPPLDLLEVGPGRLEGNIDPEASLQKPNRVSLGSSTPCRFPGAPLGPPNRAVQRRVVSTTCLPTNAGADRPLERQVTLPIPFRHPRPETQGPLDDT
jgi:hypothetical protein